MTATIVRADARCLPLPGASVDLIVTSPPYFALRSYTDGGEHYEGQIGSEATPAEYVANLLECTREWVRVLKPSGSIWVNLGDKYAGSRMDGSNDNGTGSTTLVGTPSIRASGRRDGAPMPRDKSRTSVAPKSLIGLPWRYALACIDQLGLILRAEVIWSKPNGLPESVTDRVRRSHEQWFHFTTQPRYFSVVDEIRDEHSGTTHPRGKGGALSAKNAAGLELGVRRGYFGDTTFNPLGKLPGSVWEIATQPLTAPKELGVNHFAAFPMEWPRRIILGWSPAGICTACGEGRRPVTKYTPEYAAMRGPGTDWNAKLRSEDGGYDGSGNRRVGTPRPGASRLVEGYACACPEPTAETRPAVILDPFGGTGTTALVASALGRHGISVDRSADYCRLAQWRVNDPGQRAAAMQVDKPEPVHRDQLELEWEMTA